MAVVSPKVAWTGRQRLLNDAAKGMTSLLKRSMLRLMSPTAFPGLARPRQEIVIRGSHDVSAATTDNEPVLVPLRPIDLP